MESEHDDESQESKSLNIIRVEYDDSYENISVSTQDPLNSSAVKGKYYKQTYRPAWEHMPDFKGWLRGVQGEPTRAYCTYCQKTLHAHRLSLLKHTCTIRHQKAAQLHNSRANKSSQMEQIRFIESTSSANEEIVEGEDADTMIEYASAELEDGDQDQDGERDHEIEEEEETVVLESLPVQFQRQIKHQIQQPMSEMKPPISTHVVDTTRGVPVNGLQVSLYKLIDGRWTYINEGVTNQEGTFCNFLERSDFSTGRYKLHFDVDRFFEARKQDTLYPFIEIVFDCRNIAEHYNVPLLLNPFGYSTYRGS